MRPLFKVYVNGRDITARIKERLIEIRMTDEVGFNADALTIILDDERGQLEVPPVGVSMTVMLGYDETGITRVGEYIIDEAELSGPPDRLIIRAKAADMCQALKTSRRRSWDQKTLGDIIQEIAGRYGMKHRVTPALTAIYIEHVEQNNESDLHFLTRLAKQYNAVWKPVGSYLVFITSQEGKTPQGTTLSPFELGRSDVSTYSLSWAERSNLKHVTAYWRDKQQAIFTPVIAGDESGPGKILHRIYPNAAEAGAAANAELKALQRAHQELSITMTGNLFMIAESPVVLTNKNVQVTDDGPIREHYLWRDGYLGQYTVYFVEHQLTSNGYSTYFRAR